jgi:hypothetical protein
VAEIWGRVIDPDLSPEGLPSSAKCVVLREVSPLVDDAVEDRPSVSAAFLVVLDLRVCVDQLG